MLGSDCSSFLDGIEKRKFLEGVGVDGQREPKFFGGRFGQSREREDEECGDFKDVFHGGLN